jgi:hypothetical protein
MFYPRARSKHNPLTPVAAQDAHNRAAKRLESGPVWAPDRSLCDRYWERCNVNLFVASRPRKPYPWTRFWYPIDEVPSLVDGYLAEPGGWSSTGSLVTLADVTNESCLLLRGEPGMGKSTELEVARAFAQSARSDDVEVMSVQLRDVDAYATLEKRLLNKAEFQGLIHGSHRLILFLDSLDEGLLGVPTLASALVAAFNEMPLERLSVRLASRAADWPQLLSDSLAGRPGFNVLQLQLAPLRESDVRLAAECEDLPNVDAFIQEIRDRDVTALAARPVTLRLLLTIFQSQGSLPRSRKALYDQGCLLLATEVSQSRKAARRRGELGQSERLAIAGRIAFLLTFANKSAVWTDADYGDVPQSDVMLDHLVGGVETAGGVRVNVRSRDLREVLDTALFTGRGDHRVGFSHQTYAEHLAAWYAAQHKLPWSQVASLLLHNGDPERRVVPQLHETAARLAERGDGIRQRIISSDPVVLVASDLATATVEHRRTIVDALLVESRRTGVSPVEDKLERLSALNHPTLQAQLQGVLADVAEGYAATDAAIDIAVACGLTDLSPMLAEIALDSSRLFRLRLTAAYGVIRIGNRDSRERLTPLALTSGADDDYDQLKGCALLALWPDLMTVPQVLAALTRPRHPSHFGPYEKFLHEFAANLPQENIVDALNWAKQYALEEGDIGACVTGILRKAWEHLLSPGVLEPFAQIARARLKQRERIVDERDRLLQRAEDEPEFDVSMHANPDRRRALLRALVSLMDESADPVRLVYARHLLVDAADVPWMINELRSGREPVKARWSELIWSVFLRDAVGPDVAELIYNATVGDDAEPSLKARFATLFEPIELDSPRAKALRAEAEEMAKWQRRDRAEPQRHPATAEHINRMLERFESGDFDAWWQLTVYIGRDAEGLMMDSLYLNPAEVPVWNTLDPETKERIVAAAHHYLLNRTAQPEQWLGKPVTHWPAVAGYRAFVLLQDEAPDKLATLPEPVWSAWAPILVAHPAYGTNEALKPTRDLINRAYRADSDGVIRTVRQVIEYDDKESKALFVLERIEEALDAKMRASLLEMVRTNSLSQSVSEMLLRQLLAHHDDKAETYAAELIQNMRGEPAEVENPRLMAGRVLLATGARASVDIVWPAMKGDTSFGRDLLLSLAIHSDSLVPEIENVWPENDIADLLLWLEKEFPETTDPRPEGVFTPGPRFNLGQWRHSVRRGLVQRGTPAAVTAITRVSRALGFAWLADDVQTAKEVMRRKTWVPALPEDLMLLVRSKETRLVRDGAELLRVLRESVQRFQGELLGENPLARLLWTPQGSGRWRPREEGDLADFLIRHFESDVRGRGIVAGREIVIRRGAGPGVEGDRTDIYVYAVVSGQSETDFDTISVIVEVKCAWNDDVISGVETQLVGQYLTQNQRCQHGLYVAGWYSSPVWDQSDSRRGKATRFSSAAQLSSEIKSRVKALKIGAISVKSMVLDVSLRKSAAPVSSSTQSRVRSRIAREGTKKTRKEPAEPGSERA